MKFVTVMDMWLLIINIFMLGGLFYFGRKLLKTMTRLMHIGEQREDLTERRRCLAILEAEIDNYTVIKNINPDSETIHTLELLEDIHKKIKKVN